MPILHERDRQAVRQHLEAQLKRDVYITLFSRPDTGLFIPGRECRGCRPTQELLEDISTLSPKVHLEVVDFYKDQERASDQGVDKIPATVVSCDDRAGVTFYGIPSGFEFAVLLDSIVAASSRVTPLQLETRRKMKRVREDIHIQVFVTPTCKFCPVVARLAVAMAMESRRVVADIIDLEEFPYLTKLHNVMGVPRTVINDRVQFTGAVPEDVFLQRVLEAVGEVQPGNGHGQRVSEQTTPIA